MADRPKTKPYHHGNLERALVEAGVKIIETEGASALSVRSVARAVGVSHAAPHHHFSDRYELAAAVAEDGFRQVGVRLEKVIGDASMDPVERLTSACLAYVRFAREHAGLYRSMYAADLSERLETIDARDPLSSGRFLSLLQTKAEIFGLFVTLIREGQEQNEFRKGAASDLARVATALAHGLSHEFIDEQLGSRINQHKHAREVFALMIKGLAAEKTSQG
jgi:AcrR family transcriptional regulator